MSIDIKNFTTADYFTQLNNIKKSELDKLKSMRITILRSYTAEMLEPILKLRLILEGYNPEFYWSDFNQYAQEILKPNSGLYKFKPDLILFLVRVEELAPHFAYGRQGLDEAFSHITNLINILSASTTAQIILQNLILVNPGSGIYDIQTENSQCQVIQKFNNELSKYMANLPNAFIWDFANFVMQKGYENIADPKAWYLSRNPYRQAAYIDIADDLMRYILSALGHIKKCIVLDLDNTLWGGIVGEDGIENIKLGADYPGNCYVAWQRELLKLHQRGIILAINSKNNEQDAFNLIDNHPDMVLRREHFAAWQINWQDKASNLEALAKELNIGIDSMIFIDDNPAECELIRKTFPECTILEMPKQIYQIPSLDIPGVENIKLTEEDKNKGKIYQQQVKRKKMANSSKNLAEFLQNLNMQIKIRPADKFSIPRIAQLSQKTNQFNMTTRRYTEADIIKFVNTEDSFVFSVGSQDRFGNDGIVGMFILRLAEQHCYIDSFLLSCRVIGRTIEESMLAFIAEFARKKIKTHLIGEFIPTAKNLPASDFYLKMNFTKLDKHKFIADLNQQQFTYSPYINIDKEL